MYIVHCTTTLSSIQPVQMPILKGEEVAGKSCFNPKQYLGGDQALSRCQVSGFQQERVERDNTE